MLNNAKILSCIDQYATIENKISYLGCLSLCIRGKEYMTLNIKEAYEMKGGTI